MLRFPGTEMMICPLSVTITAAALSRPMPVPPSAAFALVALVAALGACAPTHEWVNPAVGLDAREADTRDCNAAAWDYAQQRRFLYGGAYGPGFGYGAGGGGVGWSQANTLAALDRSRFFDDCMRLRGYSQRPIKPP